MTAVLSLSWRSMSSGPLFHRGDEIEDGTVERIGFPGNCRRPLIPGDEDVFDWVDI
jgi:hypothetical protein